MEAKEALMRKLRAQGFRLTPQREKVIDIFYSLPHGEHLSAEDLYSLLKQENIDISLATSYRTLKLLANESVLREVDFAEDIKHYELIRGEEKPHHHLICQTCGMTVEFESELFQDEAHTIANGLGFEPVDLQVKLFARCLPDKADCPLRKA